jgi:hypothetical protein
MRLKKLSMNEEAEAKSDMRFLGVGSQRALLVG